MEHHRAGYDYRVRFPRVRLVFAAEGGAVYAADGPEGAALISDERTLTEFLPDDAGDCITVRLLASPAARDVHAAASRARAHGASDRAEAADPGGARQSVHPVDALFAALKTVAPYPEGVVAMPGRIAGLAFFPGGAGLWGATSSGALPPMPVGGVMVLGHNFDSEAGYWRSAAVGGERLASPTWRDLVPMLHAAGIDPDQCFFTNAYVGLRAGDQSTGRFPGARDRAFVARCRAFLALQLATQRPRLVLTLGGYVPAVLAPLSPDLARWREAAKVAALDAAGCALIGAARFADTDGLTATVAALTHPSRRHLNVGERRYGGVEGDPAEQQLLADALHAAGIAHA